MFNKILSEENKSNELKKTFYSKYHVENFEEELANTQNNFLVPEDFDDNNLYWDII